jgi:hypothetical protein
VSGAIPIRRKPKPAAARPAPAEAGTGAEFFAKQTRSSGVPEQSAQPLELDHFVAGSVSAVPLRKSDAIAELTAAVRTLTAAVERATAERVEKGGYKYVRRTEGERAQFMNGFMPVALSAWALQALSRGESVRIDAQEAPQPTCARFGSAAPRRAGTGQRSQGMAASGFPP